MKAGGKDEMNLNLCVHENENFNKEARSLSSYSISVD